MSQITILSLRISYVELKIKKLKIYFFISGRYDISYLAKLLAAYYRTLRNILHNGGCLSTCCVSMAMHMQTQLQLKWDLLQKVIKFCPARL